MKAYKVKELTTEKTQYFQKMNVMCKHYGWNYNSFKIRKSKSGLPIGKRTDTGYYVITEIEIK